MAVTTTYAHLDTVFLATVDRERRDRLNDPLPLEHVSGSAWRVCDSRRPSGSSGRFIGFVEERDGRFEVIQRAETFIWTAFDSMREALTHIVWTNQQVTARRRSGTSDGSRTAVVTSGEGSVGLSTLETSPVSSSIGARVEVGHGSMGDGLTVSSPHHLNLSQNY